MLQAVTVTAVVTRGRESPDPRPDGDNTATPHADPSSHTAAGAVRGAGLTVIAPAGARALAPTHRGGVLVEQRGCEQRQATPKALSSPTAQQARSQRLAADGNDLGLDGKEGVDGSSPSEGSAKAPHVGAFSWSSTSLRGGSESGRRGVAPRA